jgi:hypothetical protein
MKEEGEEKKTKKQNRYTEKGKKEKGEREREREKQTGERKEKETQIKCAQFSAPKNKTLCRRR